MSKESFHTTWLTSLVNAQSRGRRGRRKKKRKKEKKEERKRARDQKMYFQEPI